MLATTELPTPARPDYAELKRRVRAAGLMDRQPAYYLAKIFSIVAMVALALTIFAVYRQAWIRVLDAVFIAFVSGQLGFLFHDAGHRQMFARSWKNVWVGLICGDLLLGMSYGWWVQKHNQHHANPNHIDLDPDIESPAIAYTVEQALEKRGLGRAIARRQAYLFFPLLLLQGWSMHGSSGRFLARERSKYWGRELIMLAIHSALYLGLAFYFLGPLMAIVVILIHQGLGGMYMALVFAPNHKGMPTQDENTDLDFLSAQVLTARNIRSHPLTDFWYGGLNYQVEHHLFPNMPRNRVREAHQIVIAYCREIGLPFHETSMIQSYRELLGHLHRVGEPLRRPAPSSGPRSPISEAG